MIRPELEAEILRLHHVEKWRPGTIANHLGIHHSVVARVVKQERVPRAPTKRPRMIDPYIPFILDTLGKYPRLSATRLYQMVKERGYPGKSSQFRALVAEIRPEHSSGAAYLRLTTLPGEQAQVDWGHFGRHQVGRASRPLSAFVMVFSYSRALYLRFFLSQNLSNFLHGHRLAFRWAGGVVRTCLYDNLKSVVLERRGQAIRFNPQFLQFAGHYRYEARPVAPARGNEKGRVERAVRFVRDSFFAARRFKDLDDLNRQALKWAESVAMERRWPQDRQRSVGDVFASEKEKLLPLPGSPFPCDERKEVRIPKTPYARFDLNEYSVPHTYARRILVVVASLDTVRVLAGNEVIATHRRSYDRGCQIEDPRHVEALAQEKAQAGQHRRTNLLSHAVPSAAELLEKLAERGLPLGRSTKELLELQRTYGAEAVEAAIREVLEADVPHTQGVRHTLERNRREAGRPPARPLPLPEDPRVRDLHVRPHDLETYDQIQEDHDDDQEENSRNA